VPERSVESFAGVANHFVLGTIDKGATVLDLGCGAGTDSLVAAQMVGPEGHVVGIDMTEAQLAKARRLATEHGFAQVASLDTLPARWVDGAIVVQ